MFGVTGPAVRHSRLCNATGEGRAQKRRVVARLAPEDKKRAPVVAGVGRQLLATLPTVLQHAACVVAMARQ